MIRELRETREQENPAWGLPHRRGEGDSYLLTLGRVGCPFMGYEDLPSVVRRFRPLGGTSAVMSTKSHKMNRMQFLWLRWVARHCPWYIELVAGKQADDIFRG